METWMKMTSEENLRDCKMVVCYIGTGIMEDGIICIRSKHGLINF